MKLLHIFSGHILTNIDCKNLPTKLSLGPELRNNCSFFDFFRLKFFRAGQPIKSDDTGDNSQFLTEKIRIRTEIDPVTNKTVVVQLGQLNRTAQEQFDMDEGRYAEHPEVEGYTGILLRLKKCILWWISCRKAYRNMFRYRS